jgi:hypothetical protein
MTEPRRAPTPPTIIVMDQFTVHVPADTINRDKLADETLREYGGVRLSEWEWQPPQGQTMIGRCYAERVDP